MNCFLNLLDSLIAREMRRFLRQVFCLSIGRTGIVLTAPLKPAKLLCKVHFKIISWMRIIGCWSIRIKINMLRRSFWQLNRRSIIRTSQIPSGKSELILFVTLDLFFILYHFEYYLIHLNVIFRLRLCKATLALSFSATIYDFSTDS